MTASALASAKSASRTMRPVATHGRAKSGAGVPRASMVDSTAMDETVGCIEGCDEGKIPHFRIRLVTGQPSPDLNPLARVAGCAQDAPMQHVEKHFSGGDTVRDVVIGMADGLTVPFALAAGISGAIAVTHIVVTAGLAEIAAGSIAMGLGGYLAGRSESEHYASERRREEAEVSSVPDIEAREVE